MTDTIPVLVHADESCLGNRRDEPSPGGNGALVEAPAGDSLARWDLYECAPATTNNRMALAGAIATLEWIRRQWKHARVRYVSDAEYLVKGMREWLPGWKARGCSTVSPGNQATIAPLRSRRQMPISPLNRRCR